MSNKEIDKKIAIVNEHYEKYISKTETEANKKLSKSMLQNIYLSVLRKEPGTRNMQQITNALIDHYEQEKMKNDDDALINRGLQKTQSRQEQQEFKKPAPVASRTPRQSPKESPSQTPQQSPRIKSSQTTPRGSEKITLEEVNSAIENKELGMLLENISFDHNKIMLDALQQIVKVLNLKPEGRNKENLMDAIHTSYLQLPEYDDDEEMEEEEEEEVITLKSPVVGQRVIPGLFSNAPHTFSSSASASASTSASTSSSKPIEPKHPALTDEDFEYINKIVQMVKSNNWDNEYIKILFDRLRPDEILNADNVFPPTRTIQDKMDVLITYFNRHIFDEFKTREDIKNEYRRQGNYFSEQRINSDPGHFTRLFKHWLNILGYKDNTDYSAIELQKMVVDILHPPQTPTQSESPAVVTQLSRQPSLTGSTNTQMTSSQPMPAYTSSATTQLAPPAKQPIISALSRKPSRVIDSTSTSPKSETSTGSNIFQQLGTAAVGIYQRLSTPREVKSETSADEPVTPVQQQITRPTTVGTPIAKPRHEEDKVKELQKKLESEQDSVKKLKEEVNKLEKKLREAPTRQAYDDIKQALEGRVKELEEANKQIDSLKEQLKDAVKALKKSQEDVTRLGAEARIFESQLQQANEAIRSRNTLLDEKIAEVSAAETEKTRLNRIISDQEKSTQEANKLIKQKDERIAKFEEKIREEQQKLEDVKGELNIEIAKPRRNQQEIDDLTSKIAEHERKISSLEGEKELLNTEVQELKRKTQTDATMIENLTGQITNLQLANQTLSNNITRLTNEGSVAQQTKIEELEQEYLSNLIDLQYTVDRLQSELDANNLAIQVSASAFERKIQQLELNLSLSRNKTLLYQSFAQDAEESIYGTPNTSTASFANIRSLNVSAIAAPAGTPGGSSSSSSAGSGSAGPASPVPNIQAELNAEIEKLKDTLFQQGITFQKREADLRETITQAQQTYNIQAENILQLQQEKQELDTNLKAVKQRLRSSVFLSAAEIKKITEEKNILEQQIKYNEERMDEIIDNNEKLQLKADTAEIRLDNAQGRIQELERELNIARQNLERNTSDRSSVTGQLRAKEEKIISLSNELQDVKQKFRIFAQEGPQIQKIKQLEKDYNAELESVKRLNVMVEEFEKEYEKLKDEHDIIKDKLRKARLQQEDALEQQRQEFETERAAFAAERTGLRQVIAADLNSRTQAEARVQKLEDELAIARQELLVRAQTQLGANRQVVTRYHEVVRTERIVEQVPGPVQIQRVEVPVFVPDPNRPPIQIGQVQLQPVGARIAGAGRPGGGGGPPGPGAPGGGGGAGGPIGPIGPIGGGGRGGALPADNFPRNVMQRNIFTSSTQFAPLPRRSDRRRATGPAPVAASPELVELLDLLNNYINSFLGPRAPDGGLAAAANRANITGVLAGATWAQIQDALRAQGMRSLNDITSQPDTLNQLMNSTDTQIAISLIRRMKGDGALPLKWRPGEDVEEETILLKNVIQLPEQVKRKKSQDKFTYGTIVPAKGVYQIKRQGLKYIAVGEGKKATFNTERDAQYFISAGGWGRKVYGPRIAQVFGVRPKNLSQAVY